MERPERPNFAGLQSAALELQNAMKGMKETQRKLMQITGTAWSEDRLIKAVVGPRGQLMELELDPRIYRQPNSKKLSTQIVATVRQATDDALKQTQELMDAAVPSDLRPERAGGMNIRKLSRTHDADLAKVLEEDEDDG
ncbi:MAG: YbaB/EbfC family nucleoid-associated protein [Actinocatenispora sp.]